MVVSAGRVLCPEHKFVQTLPGLGCRGFTAHSSRRKSPALQQQPKCLLLNSVPTDQGSHVQRRRRMGSGLTGQDVGSVFAISQEPFDLGECHLAGPSFSFLLEIIPTSPCYSEESL